jgi:hypothetical protein
MTCLFFWYVTDDVRVYINSVHDTPGYKNVYFIGNYLVILEFYAFFLGGGLRILSLSDTCQLHIFYIIESFAEGEIFKYIFHPTCVGLRR